MLVQQQKLVLSQFIDIYDYVVPKDNLLRKIKELIDFSFVYDELIDKYCLNNGRNAVNPITMFKYFLDMAPEEGVIDPSSLTKFRKIRLKDMNLLDMLIEKTVILALEQGIIRSKREMQKLFQSGRLLQRRCKKQKLLREYKERYSQRTNGISGKRGV